MISGDRDRMRRFFVTVWRKRRSAEPLSALEHLVATTIADHPEYQWWLADEQRALSAEADALDGTNPFLHMGMHIALQEQLGADRPAGIRTLYQRAVHRVGDPHRAEHLMMDCLEVVLRDAQQTGAAPDEGRYLECLRRIAEGT